MLTFETKFFGSHGFGDDCTPVTAEVYNHETPWSYIGVAEFLDLSYVKPNILEHPDAAALAVEQRLLVVVLAPSASAPPRMEHLGCCCSLLGCNTSRAVLPRSDDACGFHRVDQPTRLREAHPQALR